jgi:hypothetical protein
MTSAACATIPANSNDSASAQADVVATVTACAIFCALSILCAIACDGFLEADGCSHYLYARFAFLQPYFFVNVWGRPICTALYSIPAVLGGRLGVRLTSLAVALACAFVARRLAKLQGVRRPVLAMVFMFGQPLVFLHSFSELTELPFALMLGLAMLAYRRRRFFWMTLVVALMPACRPEGFGFLAVVAVALLLHRRWWLLPILPLPLVVWDWAGWMLYGRPGAWWHWLIDNWPYAAQSLYERGSILHYVGLLPAVTGPLIFPATCIGIALCVRPWRRFLVDHDARCDVLTALIPLGLVAGHSLLYWQGKMASSGELRYLLTAAPLWAVMAARGWEWAFARFAWRRSVAWAGMAALAAGLANSVYTVVPVHLDAGWLRSREIADWYRNWPGHSAYPRLCSAHPGVYYFLDISKVGPQSLEWTKGHIASAPAGTLLVWDAIYGVFNADQTRSVSVEDIRRAGWLPGIGPSRGRNTSERLATASDAQWQIFRSPEPKQMP